jgi:hypothetical protein
MSLAAAGVGGFSAVMLVGVLSWGLMAVVPLMAASVVLLAAVVFAVCALFGIDPGPAGSHLAALARDVLRR